MACVGAQQYMGHAADEFQPNKTASESHEYKGLNVELQNNINEKLVLLRECKKSGQYVLSDFSIFIDHINGLKLLNKPSALEQAYLDKFFQSYKSLGGLEKSAEDVQVLPDPCEPILTEIKANVELQLSSQRAERPKFSMAIIDFKTCDKPDYPRISLRNEQQGRIRSAFLIEVDGSISSSFYMSSTGSPFLDSAAFGALSKCKFKPGAFDGKPMRSWTVVDYIWKLPS